MGLVIRSDPCAFAGRHAALVPQVEAACLRSDALSVQDVEIDAMRAVHVKFMIEVRS